MQRADKRKYHYIYKITRDDGKYYIGMHSTDNLEDGYFGSGKLITRSIKKYGVDRHVKEIVEFLPTRITLKQRERQLVNEEIIADKLCMNLVLGGNGGCTVEAQFARSSAGGRNPGKACKGSTFAKQRGVNSLVTKQQRIAEGILQKSSYYGFRGKNHSEETKAKMKATKAQRAFGQGEKNSQFGTCWVTNGSKATKIKKDQLNEYLSNGYSRGRKNNGG